MRYLCCADGHRSALGRASVRGKAAVNRQGHAEHEAGARTTEPEHRRGDLVGAAQPGDWLIAHDLLHGVRIYSPAHGLTRVGMDKIHGSWNAPNLLASWKYAIPVMLE